MNFNDISKILLDFARNGLGAPILIMVILAMLVLPLPPFLLDMLFTFNIALSLIVLLVVVYALRPLDFAVFPSFLLVATLLRLSLNVASTRVVLLEGHNGGDAAGKVIEAFGAFVIGGNYAVGLVVFSILIIINFVVVTKGAGRVSEVSARFTLDAMPGKQMAIDADLNAGLLTQDEARDRRAEISQEADFYGSMDGASKFVRGDAIAGILILLINIVGGLGVGVLQHDLAFSQAMEYYTLLTIGDGLVAQIPGLLLSTATAIIVTRVNSNQDMGEQVSLQVLSNPKALAIAGAIIGVLGLIPGMPNLVFMSLAGALGYVAYLMHKKQQQAELTPVELDSPVQALPDEPKELSWDDVAPVDMIGLEVGYRLIPLVDKTQGGELMSRIKGVRKKLSQELGFLIPSVHIRDNLDLAPNVYRLTLMGVNIGEVEIHPDRELAINPGQVFGDIQGIATKDPAFGLDAVWVDSSQKDQAQTMGYTVVDPGTVVATHLSQIIQTHAHELLGHEEVQQMLDTLKKSAPKLVEDLVPETISLGTVVKVLQNLLQENIPVRDMRTIAETLIEHGRSSQDAGALTAAVRIALGRSIVQKISGLDSELSVITLDPDLERLLQQSLQASEDGSAGLEPGLAERMINALQESTQKLEMEGKSAVLLVSGFLRPWLAHFVRHSISTLNVLSYNEIPEDRQVRVVGSVGQNG
ncbi:MAG: flagellar biosynthesis protein FlhA [Cycloclasticus pugetii]|jgi:flagellar biosynthesis protein FlhA|uniref:Flagellar biosynthesis protein FlhA n=1 Tax=Cycloclasticus zancles 78-ME TaxID=1198232 RepID=S5TW83_9GAMM|nr:MULTISPECIES: flagellar biosynthesis protein FlhA [Cycloclasticus]AGS39258.1 Flagellar biosynthesis protein FlhA [Cycloclasticus zancles 78-ME]MBV1898910.1 flagellar biosynthesis protein FlhA [Cycloclasticus sp.]MDF1828479.1 flagellar biosynthesis protein FlhA [Cycloclasticus pugetii]